MSTQTERRDLAETIFRHAVNAVQPGPLIQNNITLSGSRLLVAGETIDLTGVRNIYVLGAGKATASMAQALENVLGDIITGGVILVKYDHTAPLRRITCIEAAHPVPDENGVTGTLELLALAKKADENDLVICLLSGGGSALLIDLPPDCTLPQLQTFFNHLLKSGADITEVNTVRKHLSAVKGGGLAKAVYPARLLSLVLSDVIGDPLDVIASGPTVPDLSTFADAVQIVKRYHLWEQAPAPIRFHLEKGLQGEIAETPKAGDAFFQYSATRIIGSNAIALKAAQEKAENLGFTTRILTDRLTGEAREIAQQVVTEAQQAAANRSSPRPVCLLWGGETTVTVRGNGLGGRNQELALAAAMVLEKQPNIVVLAGGTDGTDGPNDAAGAVADGFTAVSARSQGLDALTFLNNNDSYHFFQQAGGHLMTGPTLTNVMDVVIALVF